MSKKRRSLFSKIFGNDKNTTAPNTSNEFQILNGYKSIFTNYDGRYYDDISIRTCVDAIARNAAKLYPKHIRPGKSGGIQNVNGNLQRLLSKKPNEIQNAYQFFYQVISELELFNNSYIYISRDDKNQVVGLYPLHWQEIKFYEYKEEVYIQFKFGRGKTRFVALKDCIHLTRFVGDDGLNGGNNSPIIETLSLKHIFDEGIVNAIKTTQAIRGVIKTNKAMLKPEDVAKMRNQFVKDFINNADGTGIGGLDATSEFSSVKLEPITATSEQTKELNENIMSYYGTNINIIQSKYSEEDWNAFYESVLEPIGLQMGLEFTNKLFSATEIYHGNEIVFTSNRLQYASNNTKISLIRYANNLLMIDELREILNLEPLPDGKGQIIMQDLNHIDSDIANDYQKSDSSNSGSDDGNTDTEPQNKKEGGKKDGE